MKFHLGIVQIVVHLFLIEFLLFQCNLYMSNIILACKLHYKALENMKFHLGSVQIVVHLVLIEFLLFQCDLYMGNIILACN